MDGPEIPAGKYVGEGRVFAMRDCGVGRRSRITAIAPDHDVRLQCQPVQLRMEPTATASHYSEEKRRSATLAYGFKIVRALFNRAGIARGQFSCPAAGNW